MVQIMAIIGSKKEIKTTEVIIHIRINGTSNGLAIISKNKPKIIRKKMISHLVRRYINSFIGLRLFRYSVAFFILNNSILFTKFKTNDI